MATNESHKMNYVQENVNFLHKCKQSLISGLQHKGSISGTMQRTCVNEKYKFVIGKGWAIANIQRKFEMKIVKNIVSHQNHLASSELLNQETTPATHMQNSRKKFCI